MTWETSRYNLFFDVGELQVGYNSRSGEYLELDAEGRALADRILASPDDAELDPKSRRIHESFIERGFLVPAGFDEVVALEARHRGWSTGDLMILTITLTQDCNFDCPYCFEPHLKDSAISADAEARVLAYIRNKAPGVGTLAIDWYGGEPLLELETLVRMDRAIGAACAEHGVKYESSVSTNGWLLTPDVVDRLARETSVRSCRVCVDGPQDLHDQYRPRAGGDPTFEVIWKNLEYAVQKLKIKLRINVDKQNWRRADELLEKIELGVLAHPNTAVAVKPIVSARIRPDAEAFTPREYAMIEPELKKQVLARGLQLDQKPEQSCGHCAVYSANQFMIDFRGLLYKCSDTFSPAEAIGRISEDGIAEVDDEKLQRWLDFPTEWDDQCRRCSALPLCMGGCTFKRFAVGADWCGAERYNLIEYAKLRYLNRLSKMTEPQAALVQLRRARLPLVGSAP